MTWFERNDHQHKAKANQHNHLLEVVSNYVAELRPRFVLIEDVAGLISHHGGKTLKDLLARLEVPGPPGLRYRVKYHVFDGVLYGMPQAHKPLLILCVQSDSENEELSVPSPDLVPLYSAIRNGGEILHEIENYRSILYVW